MYHYPLSALGQIADIIYIQFDPVSMRHFESSHAAGNYDSELIMQ